MRRENDSFVSPRDAAITECMEMAKATANLYRKWAEDAANQVPTPDYVAASAYASKCAGALGVYMELRSLLSRPPETRGEANPNSAQAEGTSHE